MSILQSRNMSNKSIVDSLSSYVSWRSQSKDYFSPSCFSLQIIERVQSQSDFPLILSSTSVDTFLQKSKNFCVAKLMQNLFENIKGLASSKLINLFILWMGSWSRTAADRQIRWYLRGNWFFKHKRWKKIIWWKSTYTEGITKVLMRIKRPKKTLISWISIKQITANRRAVSYRNRSPKQKKIIIDPKKYFAPNEKFFYNFFFLNWVIRATRIWSAPSDESRLICARKKYLSSEPVSILWISTSAVARSHAHCKWKNFDENFHESL